MKRTDPQFKFRLPEVLKERLEASARESGRSLSAEIVHRLTNSYEQESETASLWRIAIDSASNTARDNATLSLFAELLEKKDSSIHAGWIKDRANASVRDSLVFLDSLGRKPDAEAEKEIQALISILSKER